MEAVLTGSLRGWIYPVSAVERVDSDELLSRLFSARFPYANLEHASGGSTPLTSFQVHSNPPSSFVVPGRRITSISEGRMTRWRLQINVWRSCESVLQVRWGWGEEGAQVGYGVFEKHSRYGDRGSGESDGGHDRRTGTKVGSWVLQMGLLPWGPAISGGSIRAPKDHDRLNGGNGTPYRM